MIEKIKTPIHVSEELRELVEVESPKRPEVFGFAIDGKKTRRPEDAVLAERVYQDTEVKIGTETLLVPEGSFKIHSSIIEASLLDREGDSVRCIVDAIRQGKEPDMKHILPRNRGNFNYGLDFEMPSLSITAYFHKDKGVFGWNLERTKINAARYRTNNGELDSPGIDDSEIREIIEVFDPKTSIEDIDEYNQEFGRYLHWQDTKDFVEEYINRQKQIMGSTSESKTPNDETVISTFMNLYNIGTSELQEIGNMPQLVREHYIDELEDGTLQHRSGYTSAENTNGHYGMNVRLYGDATRPIRSIASWINQVSLSYFMDTEQSLLTTAEVDLIADWLRNKAETDRARAEAERKKAELIGSLATNKMELVAA